MPEVRLIDGDALEKEIDDAMKKAHDQFNFVAAQLLAIVKQTVQEQPTVEADIDRAAILRLCNEIEMIIVTVCDTGYTLQIGDEEAIMKRTKAIRKELAEDAGSKTD